MHGSGADVFDGLSADAMRLITEPTPPADPAAVLADDLSADAMRLIDASVPASTRRVYDSQWRSFVTWRAQRGLLCPQPTAADVANYLAHRALVDGVSRSTIDQAVAAISWQLRGEGRVDVTVSTTVRSVLEGSRRDKQLAGGGTHRKAPPVELEHLVAMMEALDRPPRVRKPSAGVVARDRAILLVGWFGAFRREELAALRLHDIESYTGSDGRDGYLVTVRRSKNHQTSATTKQFLRHRPTAGEGAAVLARLCPVRALETWLAFVTPEVGSPASGDDGAVFRRQSKLADVEFEPGGLSGKSINEVVQRVAKWAAIKPPAGWKTWSAHSLRRGYVTEMMRDKVDPDTNEVVRGAGEFDVMAQTGHRSVQSLVRYFRPDQERMAAYAERTVEMWARE